MRREWASVVGLAAMLVAGAPVVAQDIAMEGRYQQSVEVLARYPDLPMPPTTVPGLTPGREVPTTQAELERFVSGLARAGGVASLQTLATTPQGRTIPLLWLTADGNTRPDRLRASGKPMVWIIAQQHGDEPAGADAALVIAEQIATGPWRRWLDVLSVAIVPRLNPDGAAAGTRDNAAGQDLNRDHAALTVPEVQALHLMIRVAPPDLVIDLHEFSVARRWIEKFGALQSVDLMSLDATHPMVPAATRDLARELFAPVIEAAAVAHGLSTFAYHTTSTRRADRTIALGGNAPGIARNAFGLMGAVSFLIETRGVGVGAESYQRRVASHVRIVEAMLGAAAANAGGLKSATRAARAEIAQARQPLVVTAVPAVTPVQLPLLDPATATLKPVDVPMTDSRRVTSMVSRARPGAYVVLAEATATTEPVLAAYGAVSCRLEQEVEVVGELFEMRDRRAVDRRAINPDTGATVALRDGRVLVPPGSLWVPLRQPAGTRIATALEPDMPGSLLATGVMPTGIDGTTVPVVRLSPDASNKLGNFLGACFQNHRRSMPD